MRLSIPLLTALALTACSDAASDGAAGELSAGSAEALSVDAELTNGGTTCPEANWLALDAYTDAAMPPATDDFLAVNSARDDVMMTDSGLQYRVVQPGLEDGAMPELDQQTEVHYHGYFPTGDVFDSSLERGESISFAPSQVIAGWTEALTGMTVCEARTLYVPGNLAYGSQGRPGIPPNATLVFNVQVLGVQ